MRPGNAMQCKEGKRHKTRKDNKIQYKAKDKTRQQKTTYHNKDTTQLKLKTTTPSQAL